MTETTGSIINIVNTGQVITLTVKYKWLIITFIHLKKKLY